MANTTPYESIPICDWDQLVEFNERCIESGGQWIFRGHNTSRWNLSTRLERALGKFEIDLCGARELESNLIRRFERQCYHYIESAPKSTLEWLALMQHYGAPTRLLDWTYSFWVAVYFAVESAAGECAVWALNSTELIGPFRSILTDYPRALESWERDRGITEPETFEEVFIRETPILLVGAVNPFRLNERLVIQQGVFLCPGDVTKSFQTNLDEMFNNREFQGKLIKLIVSGEVNLRKEILLRLHRINMNSATLFPGLDGFARSLETLLAFPEILIPD